MLDDLRYRLRAIFRPGALERELDDELRFHLEHHISAEMKNGCSREEATRRALLLFGGVVIAMAALGFAAGIANHRGTTGKLLLAALLAGTILVVLDLDRPRRGIFRISQEPMLHLKQLFERDVEANK